MNYNIQQPGIMQGLNMLSQGIQTKRRNQIEDNMLRQQQEDRDAAAQQQELSQQDREGLAMAIQSGDPNKLLNFIGTAPHLDKAATDLAYKALGITEENQKQAMIQDMMAIGSGKEPEKVLANRIDSIQARNGDASHTIKELEEYRANPEEWKKTHEMAAAVALSPQQYAQYKDIKNAGQPAMPEYGPVTYNADGEAFALNKTTNQIEKIPGPKVVKKQGPQTVVNNITNSQNEQDKVIAKAAGDIYNSYMQDANTARKNDLTLNRLEKLNEKAFDGVGAGAYKSAAKLAKAVGINVEGLTETELFDSLSNELVLGQTSKLTGVLTDKDMELLATTVPQLSQTKEGRKKLIQVMKEINNASKEQAKLAREYRNSDFGGKPKGQFDDIGFQEYLESQPKSDRFSNLLEGEGTVLRGGSESPAAGTYTSKSGITFKVR